VPTVNIRPAALTDPDAVALIGELNAELTATFPEPGATHFTLAAEQVGPGDGAFLIAYIDGQPVGCGAVRRVDATTGELKRMYVRRAFRQQGVGHALIGGLEREARTLRLDRVVLETGTRLDSAIRLYQRHGYQPIPLFGEYLRSSDTSLCFGKSLHNTPSNDTADEERGDDTRRVEGLIATASSRRVKCTDIQDLVKAQEPVPPMKVLDQLAFCIAHGYLKGQYDFAICDAIMNEAFGYAHQGTDLELSAFAWGVFEAFDQGEFRGEEVTRSLLSAVLSRGYLMLGDAAPPSSPQE
jgi:putative acetyltransferase